MYLHQLKYLSKHRLNKHVKNWAGPRVVVSTAAFHAGVRGSFAGLGGLKETKMFLPHPLVLWGVSVTER